MSGFEEFPKVLVHPGEAAAVVSVWDEKLNRHVPEHGIPARFQPVTVNNADQEDQYEARGYRPAGSSDAAAFESAISNAKPEGYEFKEYPKWVGDVLVNAADEETLHVSSTPTKQSATRPKAQTYKQRTQGDAATA